MRFKRYMVLGALLALSSAALDAKEWYLAWCELGPIAQGKKVKLLLTDGERVRGKSVAVQGQSLRFLVTASSDNSKYPPGQSSSFTRGSIQEIRIIGTGHRGKVIGAVAGIVGGAFAGYAIGYATDNGGVALGTWIGSSVAGIALGDMIDRDPARVHLKPGNEGCSEVPELTRKSPDEPGEPQLVGLGGESTYMARKGNVSDSGLNRVPKTVALR